MSKKSIIGTIISLSVLLVILFICLVVGLLNENSKFIFVRSEVLYTQEYNAKDIAIDSKIANINIKKSTNELIKLEIIGDKKDKYEINDNELLTLDYKINGVFSLLFTEHTINVYLPENYTNNITINTKTGNVESDIDLYNIKVNATTGNIKLKQVNNKIDFEVTTGNIAISKLYINENSKVKTSTGNIAIEDLEINSETDIKLSTGNVKIDKANILANTNIKLSTGNVKINEINNNIFINTSTKTGNNKTIESDRFSNVELKIEATTGNIKVGV